MTLPAELPEIVLAVGALGTAAQALVDASKIGNNGGLSNAGFEYIEQAVAKFLPNQVRNSSDDSSTSSEPRLADLLHANWINGIKLADQKATAKAGVKLYLTNANAGQFAQALGMTATQGQELAAIADKIAQAAPQLDDTQHNLLGQFDLMLGWIFDEAYQRADQQYRNRSKFCAMWIAVLLAIFAAWVLGNYTLPLQDFGKALVIGLISTPLAPISKDLASALQAAVKAIQMVKK